MAMWPRMRGNEILHECDAEVQATCRSCQACGRALTAMGGTQEPRYRISPTRIIVMSFLPWSLGMGRDRQPLSDYSGLALATSSKEYQ